ncbi:zinc-binding dehydrogenase [Gigaspora rosea]|uniref:Zinc-binding dehydrogenase n=1 Tax=Gigaspora rosea TaxID=44941 RepID=A0A397UQG2_9GLOM|nr:zinc-binding dehydrogenase [Gigaspora rosea]
MSLQNTRILFVKRPHGLFEPSETFKIVKEPVPSQNDLSNGQLLVKNFYLSLDPAMRGMMNDVRSYTPPLAINELMRGNTVGGNVFITSQEIILSKNSNFKVGDKVTGSFGWQEYAVSDGKDVIKIVPPPKASLRDYLGLFGITGLTAYFGLLYGELGKRKTNETVVVSGAAGATGSVVGQIAKLKGARVIGIAGTPDKCAWLVDELGFDVALNYRDPDFAEQLTKATPNYIDVYFDNVGGDILNLCLKRIAKFARIVLCGAISQYNEKAYKGPSNYVSLIAQSGKMEGFIVYNYKDRYQEAVFELSEWLQQGKIKTRDYVVEGLENAPQALLRLFKGENTGKMLIKIANENVKSQL